MKYIFFITLFAFTLCIGSINAQDTKDLMQQFKPTDEFPKDAIWINSDFPISNTQIKNKLLVVNFFALDCPACNEGMHKIQEVTSRNMQTQLITVMVWDQPGFPSKEEVLPLLRYHGIEHPVVIVHDLSSFKLSNPTSLPTWSVYLEAGKPVKVTSESTEIVTMLMSVEETLHTPEPLINFSSTRFESNLLLQSFAETLLKFPSYLDAHENDLQVFISDAGHHRILMADYDGEVNVSIGSAIRGFRDGTFFESSFYYPGGISYDEKGSRLYIADTENHRVRVADMNSRTVSTLVGNGLKQEDGQTGVIDGVNGSIGLPTDLIFQNGSLFVLSAVDNTLYKVVPSSGRTTIFAKLDLGANHFGVQAVPVHIMFDEENEVFVVTCSSGSRFAINKEGVSTLITNNPIADEGIRASASYKGSSCFSESDSNRVFIKGAIEGTIGSLQHGLRDGKKSKAMFFHPSDLVEVSGRIYLVDTYNHAIRVINPKKKKVTTLALDPSEQMMRSSDAATSGEHVFLPEVDAGQGINSIMIELDLGTYRVWSEGINEVHPDGVSGVVVKSFDPAAGRIELELDASQSTGSIMLEFFLSVEHPDQAGSWMLKTAFITIPVELSGAGTNDHQLYYKPDFFPVWK